MDMKRAQITTSPTYMCEIIMRVAIWTAFICLELVAPFERVIQPEEMWLYKYPHTGFQYVSGRMLWLVSICIPLMVLVGDYAKNQNRILLRQGLLALTLLLGLNGFVTVFLKLIVGRPRPDFYHRCWPDGSADRADVSGSACTGDRKMIAEGRKSFPSGHASFSFASMVFVALFAAARLRVFEKYRGVTWRLFVCIAPIILATAIAISRTCDYHHHWQDVVCGALIGMVLAYICYNQYLPAIVRPAVIAKPSAAYGSIDAN